MGGKPRTKYYEHCFCCDGVIRAIDILSCTPAIPVLTLRKIGLCQDCLQDNCFCENVDDLCDQLCELESTYDGRRKTLQTKIDALEAAKLRANVLLKAVSL